MKPYCLELTPIWMATNDQSAKYEIIARWIDPRERNSRGARIAMRPHSDRFRIGVGRFIPVFFKVAYVEPTKWHHILWRKGDG